MSVKLNVSCSEWWFLKFLVDFVLGRVLKGFVAVVDFSVFRFLPVQFFFLQFEVCKFWVSVGFGVVFLKRFLIFFPPNFESG
jgi:hypothetical protein